MQQSRSEKGMCILFRRNKKNREKNCKRALTMIKSCENLRGFQEEKMPALTEFYKKCSYPTASMA